MIQFSAPSSSSAKSSGSSKSGITLGESQGALPFGLEAALRLGGVIAEKESNEVKSTFDLSLIQIPEGVTPQNLHKFTHYEVLGFPGELGDSADVEAIKKAYHKAVLMYHPDKAPFQDKHGNEDRSVFLKIQEAFKVLCSEPLRRAYDSQLPFDDAIPNEEITDKFLAKGPHKFFKLYGPIFKRNARWSTTKPVPELGNLETPLNDVLDFYSFWNKFESWRDYMGKDCDNRPEDAGDRAERRYLEKENIKKAVKMKAREMQRIIDLVTLAEKKDPRIVAAKQARKDAKEAAANARENNAKMAAENEANALAWIEAEETKAKDANGVTKAERDKVKKKMSNERNLLKKLLRVSSTLGHGDKGEYGPLSPADVDLITANADMSDLSAMTAAMGGNDAHKDNALFKADGLELVNAKLSVYGSIADIAAEDEKLAKEAKKRETDSPFKQGGSKAVREWTEEQDDIIKAGLARYSVSHATRWDNLTNFANDRLKIEANFLKVKEVQVRAWQLSTSA
jgi:DnaJ homolog subfamily C member 2